MTKAELEAEAGRLRAENEDLRYVATCLLDANRCKSEALGSLAKAEQHLLDALRLFTAPTIPNN